MEQTAPQLDISPLANAVARLREGLARHQREPADEQVRDGLIRRFEHTYELCHRMLRRFIQQTAASPEEVDRMAFQDLIRTNQRGLLVGDWPAWRRYRDLRARTSHTYRAETAQQQVADAIPAFLAEAEFLRDQLQSRLA